MAPQAVHWASTEWLESVPATDTLKNLPVKMGGRAFELLDDTDNETETQRQRRGVGIAQAGSSSSSLCSSWSFSFSCFQNEQPGCGSGVFALFDITAE
jgi:hypothetical protein